MKYVSNLKPDLETANPHFRRLIQNITVLVYNNNYFTVTQALYGNGLKYFIKEKCLQEQGGVGIWKVSLNLMSGSLYMQTLSLSLFLVLYREKTHLIILSMEA